MFKTCWPSLIALSLSGALAQTPPAPTPPAQTSAAQAVPAVALGAPVDTLREYRLEELSRVRFSNVQTSLEGGTPEQAAAFDRQFRAALEAREGEQRSTMKQFLKVLPAANTPGRYLLNTVLTSAKETTSLRSVRTLGGERPGRLDFEFTQPAAPAGADATQVVTAQMLQLMEAELALSHAELLSSFDPASWGILTGPGGAKLLPGQTFTRRKVLRPLNPFAPLGGETREALPILVEQTLKFVGEEGEQLVFSRQAQVRQPGQIVTGEAETITVLLNYVYSGELRLTPDGLPLSATRDEAYVAQVSGKVRRGTQQATFGMTVTSSSALTLTPVAR